jgi:uncharacterized membrane protein
MTTPARGDFATLSVSGADPMLATHTVTSATPLVYGSRVHSRVGPPAAPAPGGRIAGIDAARGLAMVLVCLSHVREHFASISPDLYELLTNITRLATPSFLLLSGFVAAYVLRSSARANVRIALVDRGLFVLVVGHLLLGLEDLRTVEPQQWLFARVVVTDAIAVCLILAGLLRGLSASGRIVLGLVLALVSWPFAMTLSVDSELARYLGAVLINARSTANGLVDAALIPYLGVFLVGMGVSEWVGREIQSGDSTGAARKLLIAGGLAICCAIVGVAVWLLVKHLFGESPFAPALYDLVRPTLDPRHKLPPSPSYLLFYGGSALVMAAFCLTAKPRVIMQPVVRWASVLGRASLMCFLVQDWLLRVIPNVLGFQSFESVTFWAIYFIATVAVLHWLATHWDAVRGNRFLTIGLKSLARRFEVQPIESSRTG